MSDALRATGRNILLNLCNWGEDQVHTVSSEQGAVRSVKSDNETVGNVNLQFVAHHWRHL